MSKLSKEELLEKLSNIEAEEQMKKDILLLKQYNGKSFFYIWKKSTNWYSIIFIWVILLLMSLFPPINIIFVSLVTPMVILLSLTHVFEIKEKIRIFTKNNKK